MALSSHATEVLAATVTTATALQPTRVRGADEALVPTLANVSRNTAWTKAATIPIGSDAFDPHRWKLTATGST